MIESEIECQDINFVPKSVAPETSTLLPDSACGMYSEQWGGFCCFCTRIFSANCFGFCQLKQQIQKLQRIKDSVLAYNNNPSSFQLTGLKHSFLCSTFFPRLLLFKFILYRKVSTCYTPILNYWDQPNLSVTKTNAGMEREKTQGRLKMLNYTGFHTIGRRDQGGHREKQRKEVPPSGNLSLQTMNQERSEVSVL